jgi:hypothetical protein
MSNAIAQSVIAAGTVLLSGIGIWVAHNYRRQLRVKLADRRFEAYTALWEISGQIRVSKAADVGAALRSSVSSAMDDWYFTNGYGLLLPAHTRNLYFSVRQVLDYPADKRMPKTLNSRLLNISKEEREFLISCACLRYLSTLRAQLKADLAVYGRLSHTRKLPDERELLSSCGISPGPPPLPQRPSTSSCICGTCFNIFPENPHSASTAASAL